MKYIYIYLYDNHAYWPALRKIMKKKKFSEGKLNVFQNIIPPPWLPNIVIIVNTITSPYHHHHHYHYNVVIIIACHYIYHHHHLYHLQHYIFHQNQCMVIMVLISIRIRKIHIIFHILISTICSHCRGRVKILV